MALRRTLLALGALAAVSCAGPRLIRPPRDADSFRKDDVPGRRTGPVEKPTPPPVWVQTPPRREGETYIVGEAIGAPDKDEALQRSWASALVRLGMAEFPELTAISSSSIERLGSSSHERRIYMRLEHVDWAGIREAKELGSPHLTFDVARGEWTAHRLLRWNAADIERARRELRQQKIFALPMPPESMQGDERRLVEAIQEIQRINQRNDKRNHLLERVMTEVKCGITVGDLIRVLGEPDRFNPYNSVLVDKEYFWGLYKVERRGDDAAIVAISRTDGPANRRLVCGTGGMRSNEEN